MTDSTKQDAARTARQGVAADLSTRQQRIEAMDQAFDFRGDVTIQTADGKVIEGYIFDRRSDVPDPYVRIMPKDGSPRVTIAYDQITHLAFTGRDTAEGKSWETWVRKYVEKKAKGEAASIESESLE